jgi:predicted Zn finger-like uncharacterized protein
MNLTCPSCGATFLVEPEQLGPAGRRLRCGVCRHTWRQVAVDEDPALTPAPETAPEPEPEPAVNPTAEQAAAKAAAEPFPPSKADAGLGEAPKPAKPEPQAEADPAAAARCRRNPFRQAVSRRSFSKPARPQPKQPQVSLAARWAISAVVVIGMASGFYYGRAPLVAMVPEMNHLYGLVGLKDKAFGFGLELRYIKSALRIVDGERVVVAEGLGGYLLNRE